MHYTLASGQRTETTTIRCPVCCKARSVEKSTAPKHVVPLAQLCCPEHVRAWREHLKLLSVIAHEYPWYHEWYMAEHMESGQLTTTMIAYIEKYAGVDTTCERVLWSKPNPRNR